MSSFKYYNKIKLIGRGSFGSCYLVQRVSDRKKLVIKSILINELKDKEREAAYNEVHVHSLLCHSNIIMCHGSFIEDNFLNIVIEYAEKGDLHRIIQVQSARKKFFPEHQILEYFVQIVLALNHIHCKNILHRDLKSKNIFISGDGSIKLGDFGISKVLFSATQFAQTVIGTPYYFSPELCENVEYNHKSDVWALGCLLYEITTLHHAFDANNLPALILQIIKGQYRPIDSKYSSELNDLITSMLQEDPNKRPSISDIISIPFLQKYFQKHQEKENQYQLDHDNGLHQHDLLELTSIEVALMCKTQNFSPDLMSFSNEENNIESHDNGMGLGLISTQWVNGMQNEEKDILENLNKYKPPKIDKTPSIEMYNYIKNNVSKHQQSPFHSQSSNKSSSLSEPGSTGKVVLFEEISKQLPPPQYPINSNKEPSALMIERASQAAMLHFQNQESMKESEKGKEKEKKKKEKKIVPKEQVKIKVNDMVLNAPSNSSSKKSPIQKSPLHSSPNIHPKTSNRLSKDKNSSFSPKKKNVPSNLSPSLYISSDAKNKVKKKVLTKQEKEALKKKKIEEEYKQKTDQLKVEKAKKTEEQRKLFFNQKKKYSPKPENVLSQPDPEIYVRKDDEIIIIASSISNSQSNTNVANSNSHSNSNNQSSHIPSVKKDKINRKIRKNVKDNNIIDLDSLCIQPSNPKPKPPPIIHQVKQNDYEIEFHLPSNTPIHRLDIKTNEKENEKATIHNPVSIRDTVIVNPPSKIVENSKENYQLMNEDNISSIEPFKIHNDDTMLTINDFDDYEIDNNLINSNNYDDQIPSTSLSYQYQMETYFMFCEKELGEEVFSRVFQLVRDNYGKDITQLETQIKDIIPHYQYHIVFPYILKILFYERMLYTQQ